MTNQGFHKLTTVLPPHAARVSAVIAMCVGVLVAFPPDARKATAQDAKIQAHLAAGEFAPALSIARRLPARADRDAWLGQIAAAQARAGSFVAVAAGYFAG